MNDAAVGPLGVMPIQQPIALPRSNATQWRGIVRIASCTARGLMRALMPSKPEPLLHADQQFADAEEPDDGNEKADTRYERVESERQPEAARNGIHADGRDKPSPIDTTVFSGAAPPRPTKLANARK